MSSVGNILKEKRESMGLSIDDIVSKTRVQKQYIEAIEAGDFSFFQGQSFYQQVFIGSYADVVGVNKNELLSQLVNDKEEFEVFSKKSPVASKNYELEQTKELEATKIPNVDEVAFDEVFEQPETTSEAVNIVEDEPTIMDSTSNEEQIEEVVVEDVEEAKSPYPVPRIFDKYLQDMDVDEIMATQKIEPIGDVSEDLSDENTIKDIISEDGIEDNITSLLNDLNKDYSDESVIDLAQVFDGNINDETIGAILEENEILIEESNQENQIEVENLNNKIVAEELNSFAINEEQEDVLNIIETSPIEDGEEDVETLNSSILDDIKKLSDETVVDEAFEQKVIDKIDYEVKNPSLYHKEPEIESTAVIDITSGIELEKIPSQRVEVTSEEVINPEESMNEAINGSEEENTLVQETLIKELENTLENKELFNNLQDSINPDNRTMDLKVAQALGDAKQSVNEEIKNEKKGLTKLDYLLIFVFIILVIVLGYIAFQYLQV